MKRLTLALLLLTLAASTCAAKQKKLIEYGAVKAEVCLKRAFDWEREEPRRA